MPSFVHPAPPPGSPLSLLVLSLGQPHSGCPCGLPGLLPMCRSERVLWGRASLVLCAVLLPLGPWVPAPLSFALVAGVVSRDAQGVPLSRGAVPTAGVAAVGP